MPDAPPNDSVLPYSDAELDTMAAGWFVVEDDLEMQFGPYASTIGKGTPITPVDTFVAAIVQSSYGERPIHFMSPSAAVSRLGLLPHTVRVGLTWKLREPDDHGLVSFATDAERGSIGAFVDTALTDTLARDVFIVRGRVTDPEAPWVDHANYTIPGQYSVMHYAGARAAEVRGDRDSLEWHVRRAEFWSGL